MALRGRGLIVGVALVCAVTACKRGKKSEDDSLGAPSSLASLAPALSRAPAPIRPPASPPRAPSLQPARPERPGPAPPRGDVDPPRADRAALGHPVPEGLRPIQRASSSELYASPYTLKSLERFFRREMPDARIEPRAYGFQVSPRGSHDFILVTKSGSAPPQVAVVRAVTNRARARPLEGEPLGGAAGRSREH